MFWTLYGTTWPTPINANNVCPKWLGVEYSWNETRENRILLEHIGLSLAHSLPTFILKTAVHLDCFASYIFNRVLETSWNLLSFCSTLKWIEMSFLFFFLVDFAFLRSKPHFQALCTCLQAVEKCNPGLLTQVDHALVRQGQPTQLVKDWSDVNCSFTFHSHPFTPSGLPPILYWRPCVNTCNLL